MQHNRAAETSNYQDIPFSLAVNPLD